MQAVLEMLAAALIWLAMATLGQFGVHMDTPAPEPKVERIIRRESVAVQKAAAQDDCVPAPVASPGKIVPEHA